MKWILLNSLICLQFGLIAQEIDFGFVTGTNVYTRTEWERAIYKAPNSYHTYIEEKNGEGLLEKNAVFNAFNFGGYFSTRYKRFSGNLEPQFYYQRTFFSFEKPFYVERVLGVRAFRLPIYLTYKLFKSTRSPFVLAGFSLTKAKNFDFSSPTIDQYFQNDANSVFDTGDNHFEKMLYTNKAAWSYMLGFGFTTKQIEYNFRFQQMLDFAHKKVEAKVVQIEFSMRFKIISSRDFTKKHFLYVE